MINRSKVLGRHGYLNGLGGNLLLLPLVGGLLVGCGGGGEAGPERFDVSGTVTYDGEPVPVGTVRFLPDSSQGNKGPAGFAKIQEGTYDTAQGGKGTVGGPHQVIVVGFDGKADMAGEMPEGQPLFSQYRTTLNLPRESTTQPIEVPASP